MCISVGAVGLGTVSLAEAVENYHIGALDHDSYFVGAILGYLPLERNDQDMYPQNYNHSILD